MVVVAVVAILAVDHRRNFCFDVETVKSAKTIVDEILTVVFPVWGFRKCINNSDCFICFRLQIENIKDAFDVAVFNRFLIF